jgi:hypothetical protein
LVQLTISSTGPSYGASPRSCQMGATSAERPGVLSPICLVLGVT